MLIVNAAAHGKRVHSTGRRLHGVGATAGIEGNDVGARACVDHVITHVAREEVIAVPANEAVVTGAAGQDAVRRACMKAVVAVTTLEYLGDCLRRSTEFCR